MTVNTQINFMYFSILNKSECFEKEALQKRKDLIEPHEFTFFWYHANNRLSFPYKDNWLKSYCHKNYTY